MFQSCLFNCSIIAGYYLNNLAMGWQTFIILIILANLIANCLHYIVGNMAVILGITKNNLLPLVTIIGWLSGIVLLLAGNQLFKIFFSSYYLPVSFLFLPDNVFPKGLYSPLKGKEIIVDKNPSIYYSVIRILNG